MLYILRPLIYAVLVHQIDQYRQTSQQQQQPQQPSDTDNGDQVSSSSGNSALVRAGGINGVVGRIAEYVTGARNSIVSRVLDCVSVDALLSALALAISFVSTVYIFYILFINVC